MIEAEKEAAGLAHAQELARRALVGFLRVPRTQPRAAPLGLPTRELAAAAKALDALDGEGRASLPTRLSVASSAKALAAIYGRLREVLPGSAGATATLPASRSFDSWLQDGGGSPRYRAVRDLQRNLAEQCAGFFARAVIHGSVSTLDDVAGFSDLDLAFVIRAEAMEDGSALIDLRRMAAAAYTATLRFDPWMHHEPFYLTEQDMAWYPEPWFPVTLFEYATDLLPPRSVPVRVRESDDLTDTQLGDFRDFFKTWEPPLRLETWYEAEWLLGSVMLLPALYLQRLTGVFRYKRFTFDLARRDFADEIWEPVATASAVRRSLPPHPSPSRVVDALAAHSHDPRILLAWRRTERGGRRRAAGVASSLGADFPARAARLAQAMIDAVDRHS